MLSVVCDYGSALQRQAIIFKYSTKNKLSLQRCKDRNQGKEVFDLDFGVGQLKKKTNLSAR
jgi:hypothetical protein